MSTPSADERPHATAGGVGDLSSPRLAYERLSAATAAPFHTLARDRGIARYLLDGEEVPFEWAEAEVRSSDALFARLGLGLWLVREHGAPGYVGFAGFRVFEEIGAAPQLLYALLEPSTGRGYATEIGPALVAFARSRGHRRLHSAADEPNRASRRVLEKIGFVETGRVPGAFGSIVLYVCDDPREPTGSAAAVSSGSDSSGGRAAR